MKTVTSIQPDTGGRRPYVCPAVEQAPSGPCFSLCTSTSAESDLIDPVESENWGSF